MKRQVYLVSKNAPSITQQVTPVSMGFLKAMALTDPAVAEGADIHIFNFVGDESVSGMVEEIFSKGVPDVMGFSAFGWSYLDFGRVAETFKLLNPAGHVIFGGVHVTGQGQRVFGMFPVVDIVVNGEGELTFLELMQREVGADIPLETIKGISFVNDEGELVTTPNREMIMDLGIIPSPFLTGIIDVAHGDGGKPYLFALMETNRGCPYRCSFCYWGAAGRQKLRKFPRERVQEELDLLARHKVEYIGLCDANFGISPEDRGTAEDLVNCKQRHGYPKTFFTSWAKKKGPTFRDVVDILAAGRVQTTFPLGVQSLNQTVLELANRKNIPKDNLLDLARWLRTKGYRPFIELVWGMPGETIETFLAAFDEVFHEIGSVATYPLILFPNTEFGDNMEKYGLVGCRTSDRDDYMRALRSQSVTVEDNQKMYRFLCWVHMVVMTSHFRYLWYPLSFWAGMTPSQVILSMDAWFQQHADQRLNRLITTSARSLVPKVSGGLNYLYGDPAAEAQYYEWWETEILPRVPAELRGFFEELIRYEFVTRPVHSARAEELDVEELGGAPFYKRGAQVFHWDFDQIIAALKEDPSTPCPPPSRWERVMYYRVGFERLVLNQEFPIDSFTAKPREAVAPAG